MTKDIVPSSAVRRDWVALPRGRVEVMTRGPLGAAEVIIAAHPVDQLVSGSIQALSRLVPEATVVAVNPRGDDPALPLAALADRVEAVRVALGIERFVFWGLSGGGWLGAIHALRYGAAVEGLVLESVCPHFRSRLDDPACVLSPRFPAWADVLSAAGLVAAAADAPVRSLRWVPLGDGEALVSEGAAVLVAPETLDAAMKAAMPHLLAIDLRPSLPALEVPVLIICGDADPLVPTKHARDLHRLLPTATVVTIEGGGHVGSVTGSEAMRGHAADAYAEWRSRHRS